MPVMVEKMGRLSVVAGTMGGRAQPQVHAQVLGRVFSGDEPADAVAKPRWVVGSLDAAGPREVIFAEPSALKECEAHLEATGMQVHLLNDFDEDVGHAQYIAFDEDGSVRAAADPRSDGTAEVLHAIPDDDAR
jgi:gamma-glutamyltranspeptidase/glutathione hydrolase